MKRYALSFILLISLGGCGSTASLDRENFVPFAIINVSHTLKVTGRLLEENETSLTVAVDGASQKYSKSEIIGFMIVKLPNNSLMMEDIVRNSSRAASNLDFFVILYAILLTTTTISIVVSLSTK